MHRNVLHDANAAQVVLQIVTAEVQSLSTSNHSPQKQMRIIATGLLALNLASVTGVWDNSETDETATNTKQRKSRIAQAERLYNDLISVS